MTPPAYERIGSVTYALWRCRCFRCFPEGEPPRVFEYEGRFPPERCPKCKSQWWDKPRGTLKRGRPPGS